MKPDRSLMTILLCCFLAVLMIPVSGSATSYNWYCKRNTEHIQPEIDSNMRFIEDHNGFYVNKNLHDSEEKRVYLTFDAGYENGNISKILDILKEKEVNGAFFILSNLVKRNPDLVKRIYNEGNMVCNHTSSHKDMTKVNSKEEFKAELEKLEKDCLDITGITVKKLYRPPEGRFDEKTLIYADELGYKTIFWSFAYADWDNDKQPDTEYAKKLIIDNIHNGAIILLHPTSATNVKVLGDVIDELKTKGYSFGLPDELIYNN